MCYAKKLYFSMQVFWYPHKELKILTSQLLSFVVILCCPYFDTPNPQITLCASYIHVSPPPPTFHNLCNNIILWKGRITMIDDKYRTCWINLVFMITHRVKLGYHPHLAHDNFCGGQRSREALKPSYYDHCPKSKAWRNRI